MTSLSPRFAVFACLCVALLLALAEATCLHSSRSPHHALHRPRATPATSWQADRHRHDGKSDGHEQKQGCRSLNLPPLLRRYRVPDRERVHKHQVQDPHGDPDHEVSKSTFTRNRYRQVLHNRRSSIYVPGEHGDKYIVSRMPRDGSEDPARFFNAHDRRQPAEGNLTLGTIDIMGSAQSAGKIQRLASLVVDATPIDWSSGQSSAMAFQLSASTSNQTQFMMIPMADATGGPNKHVALATEVYNANSAGMAMYCATYDPDPGSTSPLLMTPCTGAAHSAAIDNTTDPCDPANTSLSNSHQSQIFSYDPSSGQIEPISAATRASNLASCAGANIRRDSSNATTSNTAMSKAPNASASRQAEKVTLVYVVGAPGVPARAPSVSVASTTKARNGQVAGLTTTTTPTTTVASTASHRTISPNRAAVQPAPSTPSRSTIAIASGVPSTARSPSGPENTLSVTATSSAPKSAKDPRG